MAPNRYNVQSSQSDDGGLPTKSSATHAISEATQKRAQWMSHDRYIVAATGARTAGGWNLSVGNGIRRSVSGPWVGIVFIATLGNCLRLVH